MNCEDYKLLPLAGVGIAKGVLEVCVVPFIKDLRPSTKSWIALVGGVILYDALCPDGETLSEGFDTFVENHKLLALGVVAITAAHLTNLIPETYDPLHRLAMSS